MAFTDVVIQRLRAAGLTVHDVRAQLPTNLANYNGTRPISAITGLAIHHDAQFRSLAYDSLARYIAEANYHINKDWGGGWHGNGLQYHLKVDNVGDIFVTRDFEMLLWHCTDGNYNYLGICLDGLNQPLTHEMAVSIKTMLDVLCTQCPEFPASQGDVRAHREIPSNSTACCGDPMVASPVIEYRNTGNINADQFEWNDAPAPAPTPTPVDNRPEWQKNLIDIPDAKLYAAHDNVVLVDLETGAVIRNDYKIGQEFDIVYGTSVGGTDYYITQYSHDHNKPWGIRRIDLVPNDPTYVPPTPPVPTPAPTPPPVDPSVDQRLNALEQAVAALKSIVDKIVALLTSFKG